MKKINNAKICVLMIAIMLFASLPINSLAFPTDLDNVPFEEVTDENSTKGEFSERNVLRAFRLLKYIGAISESEEEFDGSEVVKKGYAATVGALLKNDYIPKATEQVFSDISLESEYADGVTTAYQMGIIEGTNGRFYPNKSISWDELAYMGITLLNRQYTAGSKSPRVYANQLRLFSGIDISKEEATKNDLLIFFENVLNSDYVELNGVNKKSEPQLTTNGSKSLLNSEKDIYLNDGIVTAYRFTAIDGERDLNESKIEINKAEYDLNIFVGNDFVGLDVKFYLDKSDNNNLIIDIWETTKNEKLDISENALKAYDKTSVTYLNNGKNVTKSIKKQIPVIYNGAYIGSYEKSVSEKKLDGASVSLISNDGDSTYDIVKIEKLSYYVVKSVSPASGNLVFKYDKGNIDISLNSVFSSFVFNNEEIDLTGLKAGDVLSVKEAKTIDGNKVFYAEASRNMASGEIEKISSDQNGDYYMIGGEKHYLTEEYKDYLITDSKEPKPQLGKSAVFYLASNGKIVTSSAKSDWLYGFVMSTASFGNSLDESYGIRVYTTSGTVSELYFDDKITYYDENNLSGKTNEASKAYSSFAGYTGVAAYKINGDGEVTELAKPIDRTDYSHNTIDYPLTLDLDVEKTSGGRQYRDILNSSYNLLSVPIIVHPTDPTLENDEDVYSVRSVRYWNVEHYFTEAEALALYNISEYGIADFATMFGEAATAEVDAEQHMYMITDSYIGIDNDENKTRIIEYCSGGTTVKRIVASDAEIIEQGTWKNTPTSIDKIQKGDIVQLELDGKSQVCTLRILFSVQTPPDTYCVTDYAGGVSYNATTIFNHLNLLYGKILDTNGSMVLLNCSKTGDDPSYTGPLTLGHEVYGGVSYTLYDSKNETVSGSSLSEIMAGDTVVMRKYYNHVLDVFIIR